MKRDMDLIRALLLKLESLQIRPGDIVTITPDDEQIAIDGFDVDQIDYHLSLIWEAELIEDLESQPMIGICYRRCSWQGHDFPIPSVIQKFGKRPKMVRKPLAASPSI